MQSADLERDVQRTVEKLRGQLFVKNSDGVQGVWESFKLADADGSGALDRDEFDDALHHAGVFLSTQEIGALYRKFDANGNGVIDYQEFLNGVVPPLDAERLRLVKLAFAAIDRQAAGSVPRDAVAAAFVAKMHPRVQSGELTEDAVADRILGGLPAGDVTEEDFVNHWRNLSISIPSDDFFLHMMERCWGFRANPVAAEQERVEELAALLKAKVFERTAGRKYEFRTLHELFCLVDEDDSGELSRAELALAFEYVGVPLSSADLDSVFALFDADGSGRVAWKEFARYCYPDVAEEAL